MKTGNRVDNVNQNQYTEQPYHIKHRNKILIGILIICSVIFFALFHEKTELLILLYIILFLLSPGFIFVLSRWEEHEEDKKTAFD